MGRNGWGDFAKAACIALLIYGRCHKTVNEYAVDVFHRATAAATAFRDGGATQRTVVTPEWLMRSPGPSQIALPLFEGRALDLRTSPLTSGEPTPFERWLETRPTAKAMIQWTPSESR